MYIPKAPCSYKKGIMQMTTTSVKTIEEMGYSPDFFTLDSPEPDGKLFQYYMFAGTYKPELIDTWDILGLAKHEKDALSITMRFMHIEEEMFEWEKFSALTHAQRYLRMNPSQMGALRLFFESTFKEVQMKDGPLQHFRLLTLEELRELHVPQHVIHYWEGHVYEYLFHKGSQQQERCILGFSGWSSNIGSNQSIDLVCTAFRDVQLLDPKFCPLYGWGVSTVTFPRQALGEFLFLLEQHSYEAFLARQK